MNSKKLNRLLMGLLGLLIAGLFGVTYLINGRLENQSNQLVSAKTRVTALNQEQTQLAQLKKDIQTYNDLYRITRVVVPQSKDQTEAVRQIVNLANANHIYLASISFPPSTLGTTAAPTAGAGAPASAATPSINSAATALSQLTPVPKIPGVYDLEISVESASDTQHQATYPQLIKFLSGLEQNRLTAQVNSISVVPNIGDSGQLSFSLTLDVYIKPEKKQP